jgi:prevent-host-death family protein
MNRRSSRSEKRTAGQAGGRGLGRRVIAASEFKAHCLRILEEVAAGQEVLVTKRGVEVAVVSPARQRAATSSRGRWKGMVEVSGDIVHSDWSDEFDATR